MFLKKIAPNHRSFFSGCDELVEVAKPFEDSTHQLWMFRSGGERLFLKVCDPLSIHNATFWQVMKGVFGLNLAENLAHYDFVYKMVDVGSKVAFPRLIQAESYSGEYSGFLVTDFAPGRVLGEGDIRQEMVVKLAVHLSLLHQKSALRYGPLYQSKPLLKNVFFEATPITDWFTHLARQLNELPLTSTIDTLRLKSALSSLKGLVEPEFVPIMPDLRWDQFFYDVESDQMTLVDLDAMVWGPKGLEFVLLEYLLTQNQADIFREAYSKHNEIPALNRVREVYRILLFLMGVLGEHDFAKWMAQPSRF